jgi:hypothetical protein
MILRAIDWKDCNGLILDGLAGPHICIPYDQTGLIKLLYMSILFARLILDLRMGRSKCSRIFACLRLDFVWCDHVNILSNVMPRYFVEDWIGIHVPFRIRGGISLRLNVKLICTDLVSLIFILQLLAQVVMRFKCDCIYSEATFASELEARIAVSLA